MRKKSCFTLQLLNVVNEQISIQQTSVDDDDDVAAVNSSHLSAPA